MIISDWLMPRVEGPELCRRVRDSDAPYTYFILLTALGDQQHHLHGRKSGADDYLSKPFDMEDLGRAWSRPSASWRCIVDARRCCDWRARWRPRPIPRRCIRRSCRGPEIESASRPGAVARVHAEEGSTVVAREFVGLSESRGDGPAAPDGAGGREAAARARRPEISGSTIGVPLIHEGQLLGTLSLGTRDAKRTFSREEAESLETLAALSAAGLGAIERARLEGVLLAARTAQHELNNRLGVVLGYAEMLAEYPGLPENMNELVTEIVRGAKELAETVDQLRRVTRIRETPRPEPDRDDARSDGVRSVNSWERPMVT